MSTNLQPTQASTDLSPISSVQLWEQTDSSTRASHRRFPTKGSLISESSVTSGGQQQFSSSESRSSLSIAVQPLYRRQLHLCVLQYVHQHVLMHVSRCGKTNYFPLFEKKTKKQIKRSHGVGYIPFDYFFYKTALFHFRIIKTLNALG